MRNAFMRILKNSRIFVLLIYGIYLLSVYLCLFANRILQCNQTILIGEETQKHLKLKDLSHFLI